MNRLRRMHKRFGGPSRRPRELLGSGRLVAPINDDVVCRSDAIGAVDVRAVARVSTEHLRGVVKHFPSRGVPYALFRRRRRVVCRRAVWERQSERQEYTAARYKY